MKNYRTLDSGKGKDKKIEINAMQSNYKTRKPNKASQSYMKNAPYFTQPILFYFIFLFIYESIDEIISGL